jgi:hypothetical protein
MNRKSTPRNFPRWKSSVEPNRFNESVMAGMNAPIAIRIVAGTRLWIWPVKSARAVPGSEAMRFTAIANGAMSS